MLGVFVKLKLLKQKYEAALDTSVTKTTVFGGLVFCFLL